MSVTSYIARRYFAGRKKMFASFLSVIAVTGVALGVFSLIVVMSVMRGFSLDLENKLVGFGAHIKIEAPGSSENDFNEIEKKYSKEFLSSAVVIEGEGIIESGDKDSSVAEGVKITGMDETDHVKLKDVTWEYFPYHLSNESSVITVGRDLFNRFNSDKITLIVPIGSVGPTGEIIPRKKDFFVKGIFTTGYFEYDSKNVVISKKAAGDLLYDRGRVVLNIWLDKISKADSLAANIQKDFPKFKVSSWSASNKKLFSALKLERIAMTMLLTLIVLIACISIVSVIFMYIFAKRKEIATLQSFGASHGQIRNIFIKIGAYIGAIGTLLGITAGIAVCVYLKQHMIMLPDSYYLDHLPVYISWQYIVLVALMAVLLAIFAAFYPAAFASKMDVNKLLRYE